LRRRSPRSAQAKASQPPELALALALAAEEERLFAPRSYAAADPPASRAVAAAAPPAVQ